MILIAPLMMLFLMATVNACLLLLLLALITYSLLITLNVLLELGFLALLNDLDKLDVMIKLDKTGLGPPLLSQSRLEEEVLARFWALSFS